MDGGSEISGLVYIINTSKLKFTTSKFSAFSYARCLSNKLLLTTGIHIVKLELEVGDAGGTIVDCSEIYRSVVDLSRYDRAAGRLFDIYCIVVKDLRFNSGFCVTLNSK